MPKINLCFSGWLTGVQINTVTDADGNEIDVSNRSASEIAERIDSKEWFVDFVASYRDSSDQSVEIFDVAADVI